MIDADPQVTPRSPDRPVVMFLHPSNELYGADRSLLWLVRSVIDIARVIVILPGDLPYSGALETALLADGIETRQGPLPILRRKYLGPAQMPAWIFRFLRGTLWLARTARAEHAVAIVSNTTAVVSGPVVAALLGCPHIWYVREIVDEPRWFRGLVRRMSRVPRGVVVAVSNAVAAWLGSITDRGPIVGYNGVDVDNHVEPLHDIPTALFVGRINAWKGHETYVHAAKVLHAQLPAAVFRIVGGPVVGQNEVMDALIEEIHQIDPERRWLIWDGERPEARSAMKAAWLVAVPSLKPDPLPNVVLEAMAEGRAVVASRIGGIPEMVDDGITGRLVEAGNVHELAQGMAWLLADGGLATRVGQAGRARAERNFSRRAFRSRWRAAFQQHALGRR